MGVSKYSTDKLIAEFGLVFENKLAGLKGRMLPAPQVFTSLLSYLVPEHHIFKVTPG